jgi:SAM-dependent methyltransferase
MTLKDTYNRIARDWHRDHSNDDWWLEGTNTFISLVGENAAVLDVGCGGGTKSRYLAGHNIHVTGIDFSQGMIDIAQQEVPKATFHTLDLFDADELNDAFNGVFVQAVLLHVPKARAGEAVSGLSNKLKAGGYLYVAVKERRENSPDEEVKTENDYGYPYERFFSYYTADEVRSLLEATGMDIVYENTAASGRTRWIQVIGKKAGT